MDSSVRFFVFILTSRMFLAKPRKRYLGGEPMIRQYCGIRVPADSNRHSRSSSGMNPNFGAGLQRFARWLRPVVFPRAGCEANHLDRREPLGRIRCRITERRQLAPGHQDWNVVLRQAEQSGCGCRLADIRENLDSALKRSSNPWKHQHQSVQNYGRSDPITHDRPERNLRRRQLSQERP